MAYKLARAISAIWIPRLFFVQGLQCSIIWCYWKWDVYSRVIEFILIFWLQFINFSDSELITSTIAVCKHMRHRRQHWDEVVKLLDLRIKYNIALCCLPDLLMKSFLKRQLDQFLPSGGIYLVFNSFVVIRVFVLFFFGFQSFF